MTRSAVDAKHGSARFGGLRVVPIRIVAGCAPTLRGAENCQSQQKEDNEGHGASIQIRRVGVKAQLQNSCAQRRHLRRRLPPQELSFGHSVVVYRWKACWVASSTILAIL